MNNCRLWCVRLILLIFLGAVVSAGTNERNHYSPIDSSEAVELAKAYSGFDKIEGYDWLKNVSAIKEKISNDSTPIFRKWINNDSVWHFEFKNIMRSQIMRNRNIVDSTSLAFNMLIDASNGALLRVWARLKDKIDTGSAGKSKEDREKQLQLDGVNMTILPTVVPVSLLTAMQNSGVMSASLMDAFYALQRVAPDTVDRPVWIIISYGYPSMSHPPRIFDPKTREPVPRTESAISIVNAIWTVDATTGNLMIMTGGK